MLMAAGLALPSRSSATFMTVEGQRMSKTIGNVIDPKDAAARFGVDPLRLCLVRK